jgi:threonylcarbamoyladenosine tRNA methylthiotransferase MtaB
VTAGAPESGRPAPEVVTFGCRLNAFESEVMARLAADGAERDLVIVNTCAVTGEAERQARQTIRRIKRERPQATIVVTGCAAQIAPERFAAMPEVARVVGNREKLEPDTWRDVARPDAPRIRVGDIMSVRATAPHLLPGFAEHTRVFLEVQQGCDHRCTFCVIPFGRGPSRSVPLGIVTEQARHYVRQGAREIVLTGVDLTAWGGDLPGRPSFASLVRRLLAAVPELRRLRLSSLDPAEIDDDLLSLFATERRLMPHAHLSIQAGDNLILKRMKRRHTRDQVLAVCRRLRDARPDIALGADLIAGFPTEDDAMAAQSVALIDDAGLDLVHVFPFSARSGTPAARMPQPPGPVVRQRAERLREFGAAAESRFLARQIGRTVEVLVEKSGRSGHAANFAPVMLDAAAPRGTIVAAQIVAVSGRRLEGRVAKAVAA